MKSVLLIGLLTGIISSVAWSSTEIVCGNDEVSFGTDGDFPQGVSRPHSEWRISVDNQVPEGDLSVETTMLNEVNQSRKYVVYQGFKRGMIAVIQRYTFTGITEQNCDGGLPQTDKVQVQISEFQEGVENPVSRLNCSCDID